MSADNREYQPRLLDIHFARFLAERSGLNGREKSRFEELVRLLSMDMAGGHSCLPVSPEDRELLSCCALISSGDETPLILAHDGAREERLSMRHWTLPQDALLDQTLFSSMLIRALLFSA